MPVKAKMRMLIISLSVLAVSAALVQKPFVWVILAAVALFLVYLMVVRIPTVGESAVAYEAAEIEPEA